MDDNNRAKVSEGYMSMDAQALGVGVSYFHDDLAPRIRDLSLRSESPQTKIHQQVKKHTEDQINFLYSKCLGNLKFDKRAYPEANPIGDWLLSSAQSIYYDAEHDYPLRNLHQATAAGETLNTLKTCIKKLECIPQNLKIYLPPEFPIVEDIIEEDMLTVTDFALQVMNLIRHQLSLFEDILAKMNKKKNTRGNKREITNILEGNANIPLEMFEDCDNLFYNICEPPLNKDVSNVHSNEHSNIIQDDVVELADYVPQSGIDRAVESASDERISIPDNQGFFLNSISEESIPFNENEQAYIIDLCKEILNEDIGIVYSFDSAIRGVEDKMGINLDPYDVKFVQTIESILKTQKAFKAFIKESSSCMSLTPSQVSPTHSMTQYTSRTLDELPGQAVPLLGTANMPPHIGPTFDLLTTQDDLDRHQRAMIYPSVRPKNYAPIRQIHQGISNEDQKQDFGELIFPFVKQMYPRLAERLTGMLLELPNEELMKCVNYSTVLNEHLNNAKQTLFDYAYESNDQQLKFLIEGKNQIQAINDGENYTAAFQEDSTKLNKGQSSAQRNYSDTPNSFRAAQTFNANNRQKFNNESNPRFTSGPVNQSHESTGLIPKYCSKNYESKIADRFHSLAPKSHSSPNSSYHDPLLKPRATRHLGRNDKSKYLQSHNDFQDPLFNNFDHLSHRIVNEQAERYRSFEPKVDPHKNSYQRFQKSFHPRNSPQLLVERAPDLPEEIELVLREKKELDTTVFLVERIVNDLSEVSTMDSQKLIDVLSNMETYNKSLKDLERNLSKFLKALIDKKETFMKHNPNLYYDLKSITSEVEELSSNLKINLKLADYKLKNEEITLSQVNNTESRELPYLNFSASRGINHPHIYEFIANLEQNFKITRTPKNIRSQILKKHLSGTALVAVPSDLNDYDKIVDILFAKFGSTIVIHNNILDLHKIVGVIPSKLCTSPRWDKIETAARTHLLLIRKAEALNINDEARMQIFSSASRNFTLLNLLAHENREDLQRMQNTCDASSLYECIVQRFEEVLSTASHNTDHYNDQRNKKEFSDLKKKNEKEQETHDYTLAFGERKQITTVVGDCSDTQCHFCTLFQRKGIGSNYFKNHLLVGKLRNVYPNNCPNYLRLNMDERNDFVKENNICRYCLRLKINCNNKSCGDDHIVPLISGHRKTYACAVPNCKERIELCLKHKEKNMLRLEYKNDYFKKYDIDMSICSFAEPKDCSGLIFHPTQNPDSCISNIPSNEYREHFYPVHKNLDTSLFFDNRLKSEDSNSTSENDVTRPLLIDSSEELLKETESITGNDTKSIFLYTLLPGLTKTVSCLFDTGGGSSLVKSDIPGNQLYATKETKTISLHGIGSGRVTGQQFTIILPLLDGGKTAIQVFAVDKILEPLTKIDVQPALDFFKATVEKDEFVLKEKKEEILKANIFRYIQGELDMLLGIKHLKLFPIHVHSLKSGLSIFKMVLKPASKTALYCLGGPYESLQSLQAIFQDTGPHYFFEQIKSGLQCWKNNNNSLLAEHLPFSSASTSDIQVIGDDSSSAKPADQVMLGLIGEDSDDLEQEDRFPTKELLDSLSRTFTWLQEHCRTSMNGSNDLVDNLIENELETKLNQNNFQFVPLTNLSTEFDIIIGFQCDDKFISELSSFQQCLIANYPEVRPYIIPANLAHIQLFSFTVTSAQELYTTGLLFQAAWERWLKLALNNKDFIDVSLGSLGTNNGKNLFLKSSVGKYTLQSMTLNMIKFFEENGFHCQPEFIPKLLIVDYQNITSPLLLNIIDKFSNFFLTTTSFSMVKMMSIQDNDNLYVYKSLTFNLDKTFPHWQYCKIPASTIEGSKSLAAKITSDSIEDSNSKRGDRLSSNFFNWERKVKSQQKSHSDLSITLKNDLFIPHKSPFELTEMEVIMFSEEDNCILLDSSNDCPPHNIKGSKQKQPPRSLLSCIQTILDSSHPEPKCDSCTNCPSCRSLALKSKTFLGPRETLDEQLIRSSVYFDESQNRFCCPLPVIEDPNVSLTPNFEQAKKIYKRITNNLKNKPFDKAAILKSFSTLKSMGFIEPLAEMSKELQDVILGQKLHFIPWNVVYKETSVTTPCRIVFNASSKTPSGKSLNSILAKGIPTLNILPLALALVQDPILLTLDIAKFFNSCLIPPDDYHLQCMLWDDSLDQDQEPKIHILKTHIYGIKSSTRVLEVCLEKIADIYAENKQFYSLLTRTTYVDDAFQSCSSHEEADSLIKFCLDILPKFGFKIKGFAKSFTDPPDDISEQIDGHKVVPAIGMVWDPKRDLLRIRVPPIDFSGSKCRGKLEKPQIFDGNSALDMEKFVPQHLTLRMVASKVASIWDVNGFTQPWLLGLKHILRLSCKSVNREWDHPLPTHLRKLWVNKFYEMIILAKLEFPRCTLPLGTKYTELIVLGCTDMGTIGKLQCFYSLKKINEKNYHVQLIYSKSQLTSNRSVPCEELDSISHGATTLDKICNAIGNVDRRALCTDSTIVAYWIQTDPFHLAAYHRKRVTNITKHCAIEDIFHLRGEWNPADVGTKRPEPLNCIYPYSYFFSGPAIFALGVDSCIATGCLKPIKEVIVNPTLKKTAMDGILIKALPSSSKYLQTNQEHHDDADAILGAFSNNTPIPTLHLDDPCDSDGALQSLHSSEIFNSSSSCSSHDQYYSLVNEQEKYSSEHCSEIPLLTSNSTSDESGSYAFSVSPSSTSSLKLETENPCVSEIMSHTPNASNTKDLYQHNQSEICGVFCMQNKDRLSDSPTIGYTKRTMERFSFHEYLLNPLKKTWSSCIRSMAIVFHFIRRILLKLYEKQRLINPTWLRLLKSLFAKMPNNMQETLSNLCIFQECDISNDDELEHYELSPSLLPNQHLSLRPVDLFTTLDAFLTARTCAVFYFIKLASRELGHFYSPTMLKKHSFLKNGIYYSNHRLLEVDNISNLMDDLIDTRELGIQTELPCGDRYSPVAISILLHFHRNIALHQGVDRTWSKVLSSMYIFQGQPLLTDIVKACYFCRHKLKQKYIVNYGPISKMSLTFTCVNRHIMIDMSGPYLIRTKKKGTRGQSNKVKIYLLHSVCLTSFITTILPVEDYSCESFVGTLHRLGSLYGYPSVAYTDGSKSQLKGLLNIETPLHSKYNRIYEETNIQIKVCGTGGESHSRHGRIEKSIHLFQQYIKNRKQQLEELTSFQLEIVISQAASFLNSLPLAHKKRKNGAISSALVSPFTFLLGRRSNERGPAGPPTIANNRSAILDQINNASKGMFNYFQSSIPDLLLRPANYNSSKEIEKGTIVLFPYEDDAITKSYKLGLVTYVEKDADERIRIVELAYVNHNETNLPTDPNDMKQLKKLCSFKRFTRKGVHTLSKIYSIDDVSINNDIDEINKQFTNRNFDHVQCLHQDIVLAQSSYNKL